jgi:pimeloyl-ACP methyl ester carboxylesterase
MLPVIYLHGFASSPASSKARRFRDSLKRAGVPVTIPDLASGDFAHLTITGQLRIIEEIAGGRPVDLIGSSMGGYLAALYAARHPEVNRLGLLAPAFAFHRRWSERLGAEQMEQWRRGNALSVFHYGVNAMERLSYRLMEDAARYEDFPDFRQPALIFHGVHDDVVLARESETFAATHPNARLEVVESGHDLLIVLDRIVPAVLRFLLEGDGASEA